MADIAAQFPGAIIAHQQIDDAFTVVGLQRQLAILILEQRAKQRCQHERFGQQIAQRQRISMRT